MRHLNDNNPDFSPTQTDAIRSAVNISRNTATRTVNSLVRLVMAEGFTEQEAKDAIQFWANNA